MEDVPVTPPPARGTGGSGIERKAVIQEWQGEKMVRVHSFLAAVEQICHWSKEIDVTKVNIIGDMHSGKTTMAEAICHAYHRRMKQLYDIPFAVRLLTAEHLADFKKTLSGLQPANYALIFDDVSFMESTLGRKQIAGIQAAVTTIRHMGGGDRKILLVYNFHYNMALNKFLRQSDFKLWTTVGNSEMENMERILKNPRAMQLVRDFQRARATAVNTKTWTVRASKAVSHTYRWRDPWIPVLFYDNVRLRMLVSPTRKWLSPKCATCYLGMNPERRPSEISPTDYVALGRKKYGAGAFNSAAKLILLENGLSTYSRAVKIAKRAIELDMGVKQLTLEDLMTACGFEVKQHRLRATYSKFLDAVETTKKEKDADTPTDAAAKGAVEKVLSAVPADGGAAGPDASAGAGAPPPPPEPGKGTAPLPRIV